MEFRDKLYEMVNALKATKEYKEFITLKEDIKKDEKIYALLKEFKAKQKDHQINYINGTKMSDEEATNMQNIYSILIQNIKVRMLLDNEVKLDMMLAEVQKVMGSALKEIVEF